MNIDEKIINQYQKIESISALKNETSCYVGFIWRYFYTISLKENIWPDRFPINNYSQFKANKPKPHYL